MTVTKVTEEPTGRYLRRREGGIYYFRRSIPAKLRPYLDGRAQWMRTLGTSNTALAKSLRDDESVRTNHLIREAMRKLASGILPEPSPLSPPAPMRPEELEAWEQYQQDEVEQAWADGMREGA